MKTSTLFNGLPLNKKRMLTWVYLISGFFIGGGGGGNAIFIEKEST